MNDALPKQMTALVALADLRPSPTNPRKTFAGLDDLAASIREHGVLQDILARPVGAKVTFDRKTQSWDCDHFEIVAGERRFRAAQLAGLTELPVKVRPLTDAEVLVIQLIENDQREDVKPTEQAAAYKRLVDAVGLAEAAKRVGKSASVVRGIVLLAKCPIALAHAVDRGIVGRSIAEVVCRVPGDRDRVRAAGCVLLGEIDPKRLNQFDNDGDGWMDEAHAVGEGCRDDASTLTHRETKELIAKHFTRELKQAPFSRTALYLVPGGEPDRNDYLPKCEACPKRAGNLAKDDPEYAGVRADICTDPECYAAKTVAHRQLEIEKFAKKYKLDAASVQTVEMNGHTPPGWVDVQSPVLDTELALDGAERTKWKSKPKPDVTVWQMLTEPDGIPTIQPGTCRLHLGLDAKGKPHTLVKAADVRRNLIRAEIVIPAEKPKPSVRPAKAMAGGPPPDGPYKLFRVKINPDAFDAVEFDAHEDETQDSLREHAASAFMDWFDGINWTSGERLFIDYEAIPESEAQALTPPAAAGEPPAKPFTYDF